jgi:predicted Fe-Mo cluster-binding NifX family protein
MYKKILIPLYGNDVAPRFDLATEVLIVVLDEKDKHREEKIVVLQQASAEKLCHLILSEEINAVICSGIEEEYYQYLTWKRVDVLDSVIGPWPRVLDLYEQGTLRPGAVLSDRKGK